MHPASFLRLVADDHRSLQDALGFTNTGTTPMNGGALVWGVRHPDPQLFVFVGGSGMTEFLPCPREAWEQLTHMQPPWPWNANGSGVDFDATWT